MFGKCAICHKGFGMGSEYPKPKDWKLDGHLCKECFKSPKIPDESVDAESPDLCDICKKNLSRHDFSNISMCHGCFKSKYGEILKWDPYAEYYGGHKAILAGGLISEYEFCNLYLTDAYVIAQKYDHEPEKRWEIIIPLKDVMTEEYGVEEETRRISAIGTSTAITNSSAISGGALHEEGKAHRIVLPYHDENGIPEAPVFGISSLGGKEIREWSASVYEQIVKAKQSTDISHETVSQTTSDPLTILKIRYAKGEISKEEFEEMKMELTS